MYYLLMMGRQNCSRDTAASWTHPVARVEARRFLSSMALAAGTAAGTAWVRNLYINTEVLLT